MLVPQIVLSRTVITTVRCIYLSWWAAAVIER
jgi:hypothetical protein